MSRNFDGGENLEENKDYRVYRYGDDLKPGYELKVEHSVSCENIDISALIAMGTESLEAMRQGSIDGEQKAYEIVLAAAKQWRLLIHRISGDQKIAGGMARKSATAFTR